MEIEKNIPMPSPRDSHDQSGEARKTLLKMEVGDSVLFTDGDTKTSKNYKVARQTGVRNNRKFSGRTVDGGVRVWRTA